jgi:hypothetical protein
MIVPSQRQPNTARAAVSRDAAPPEPLTAAQAITLYRDQITDHEKGEILDFPEVYFVGKSESKIRASARFGAL